LNNVSAGKIGQSQLTNGYVDLSDQTITGIKTFSSNVIVTGSLIRVSNIAVNKTTVDAGYILDVSGNTKIGGNLVVGNGLTVSSGTVSFQTGAIPTSAIASGFVDTSSTQNSIGGAKTFTGGVTVSGGLTASTAQTITFGTNAPTMSGANISGRTIPDGALSTNIPLDNGTNDFTGLNSFSNTTTFTGNITANALTVTPTQLSFLNNVSVGKIGQSQLTNGYVDLSTAQSSIGGAKTFTGGVTVSGGLTASATQTITFGTNAPTMSGANIATNSIPASSIIGGGPNSFSTGISVSGVYASTTNALIVNGNTDISGNVTAVSYNATSDRRLKANIQPLHSQWDSILSVEPVSFDWTVDGRTDIGFIAQDVYKSYPHLKPKFKTVDPSFNEEEPVDLSGNPIYYTIDYGRMTPFLWQGMKEIMQKLDRLETENKKLVERIASLESK
jgi:hypothetical protein